MVVRQQLLRVAPHLRPRLQLHLILAGVCDGGCAGHRELETEPEHLLDLRLVAGLLRDHLRRESESQ
eukprot:4962915-Alexandrium_andersonii.AAC.1